MRRASPALPLLVLAAALAGCGGDQSTLRTGSDPSRDIEQLWWVMLVGSAIVCAVVTALVLLAVLRARSTRPPAQHDGRGARSLVLFGGALVPFVVLVALFVLIVRALPSTAQPKAGSASLLVEVVGHQWFWEVRYPRTGGDVVTANEIHIPAGEPVEVRVTTGDVIHSLWVPGLNRKIDLIPGRRNRILLEADRPGRYRGQCAEFCGLQHANMGFWVIAEKPPAFDAWLAGQARPAETANGLFNQRCGGCHTVRGTDARGTFGPDLTHVASREMLAAATIPNTVGDLAAWIVDPQHAKPGNKMPGSKLNGSELQSLLMYLESLR